MIGITSSTAPLEGIEAAADRLLSAAAEAQRQTLAEWAADRRGLGARLAGDAMQRFGFTPRGDRYMARVAKSWGGRYLPYVSPKKSGNKLLFTLNRPGQGHQIRQVAGQDEIATQLTVPGARGLNFLAGGTSDRYLREWETLYPSEQQTLEAAALPRLEAAQAHWLRALNG